MSAQDKKETIQVRARELAGIVSEEKLVEKYELSFKKEAEKLQDFVGELYPKLRKAGSYSNNFSYRPDVAGDGYSAGKSLNIGGRIAGSLEG